MKMWNIAAKVPDLDREIAFVQSLGGELVLEDILEIDGRSFRVVLMKWGDKYLHLFEKAVYEHRLGRVLQNGLCHTVFEVDNLDEMRQKSLAAGARESMPKSAVSAGFGTRDVVFLESPGGILFELIKVKEHRVPVLP
jgi:predicted enzyme related to lactoylglutathione lyase